MSIQADIRNMINHTVWSIHIHSSMISHNITVLTILRVLNGTYFANVTRDVFALVTIESGKTKYLKSNWTFLSRSYKYIQYLCSNSALNKIYTI